MKRRLFRLDLVFAVCVTVMASCSVFGATLVEDYDSFHLTGTYGNWSNAGLTAFTSGPESYTVQSSGFGGGFFDLNPPINALGETQIELSVTVDASGSLPGVILALVDGDGTLQNYAWYAIPDGEHLLTKTVGMTSFGGEPGSTPGLDLSNLDFFHIQVDGASPYRVGFNNLQVTQVPEPTSFTLFGLSFVVGIFARRHRRN